MGMVHGTEKGGRLDDAYGYLHRVVILFLVILFFMGFFWEVYHYGCLLFFFILISAHAWGSVSVFLFLLWDNCLYIYLLVFLAWVGLTLLYGLGSGSRTIPFWSSTYYIDHACMYKDMKSTNTPTKCSFYAAGVGCFFFQSSMNSCVRVFGTNKIVKTWSTTCVFPALNTSKSGIFFPILINPPVLVSM